MILKAHGCGGEAVLYDVSLSEEPLRALVDVRGGPGLRDAVADALGVVLPDHPNTVDRRGDMTALWLGPDEWLVAAPEAEEDRVARALEAATAGAHAVATVVSDSLRIFRLSGADARHVLAQGCALDLHPRVFAPGRCARTGLAKTDVLLHQLDDAPTYDIYIDRSYATYLWRWLTEAVGL